MSWNAKVNISFNFANLFQIGVERIKIHGVMAVAYCPLMDVMPVTESARAHSYFFSKEVQKTCQFWLLTFWLLTVYLWVFLTL